MSIRNRAIPIEMYMYSSLRTNVTLFKICLHIRLGLIRVALLVYPPCFRPLGPLPDPYLIPRGYPGLFFGHLEKNHALKNSKLKQNLERTQAQIPKKLKNRQLQLS